MRPPRQITSENYYRYYSTHVDFTRGTRKLSVEREDGKDGIPWDHLQIIKRAVLGDVMAVEVYPTEGDLVDEVNRRHLWEFPGCPYNLARY